MAEKEAKDKVFLGAIKVPEGFATMTPAEREAFAMTVVETMRTGMGGKKKSIDKKTPTL